MSLPFFIDYLTIRQFHDQPCPVINGGHFIRVDSDGEIEFVVDSRHGLDGSFDSRVEIRSDGRTVEFSGNISRYGRPDNLFGFSFSESLKRINALLVSLGLPPFSAGRPMSFENGAWIYSGARVSRIDLTCNYSTGSAVNAEVVLRSLAGHHVGRQKGTLALNGATVEYGRGSKYVYGKVYCKAVELLAHRSRKSGQHVSDDVINYCLSSGILREEFTLKSRFLTQENLTYLPQITDTCLESIIMKRSQFQRFSTVEYEDLSQLSRTVRATYANWKMGLPLGLSVSTFYRHRNELLKYGVDIGVACNVVSLPIRLKVINLVPVSVPDWYSLQSA